VLQRQYLGDDISCDLPFCLMLLKHSFVFSIVDVIVYIKA
jgi:hypothetical protein